jgi:HSP20 family protein
MNRNDAYGMWAEAFEALERAERLQRQFFRPSRSISWEPPVDLFESEQALWAVVALPGVDADHVELLIDGSDLVVTGVRPLPRELRGTTIHRLELPSGRFERRLTLPPGRYELFERRLENGCLTLGLRKR